MYRILVIDDDSLQRALLRTGLERFGHEVRTGENGLRALELMRNTAFEPALVITDMVMPEMDGLEVIRHFRSHHPRIPVVAISGEMPETFLHLATRLGARAAFRKPVRVEQLQQALITILEAEGESIR